MATAATSVPLQIIAVINRRGRIRVPISIRNAIHGKIARISSPTEASAPIPAESEIAIIQITPASNALDGSLSRSRLPEPAKHSEARIQMAPTHSFAVEKGCGEGGQNASGIRKTAPTVIHSKILKVDTNSFSRIL